MRSALVIGAVAFAATAALLSLDLLPGAWAGPEPDGFEARHVSENAAAVAAELRLDGDWGQSR